MKWITEKRDNYATASIKSLICYAGDLIDKFKEKPIKRKLTWAYRFLKRRGFSIRRISHIGKQYQKKKMI